jgi:CHAT domain-containing protein/tetratricopeptide (TPR) repeat protein
MDSLAAVRSIAVLLVLFATAAKAEPARIVTMACGDDTHARIDALEFIAEIRTPGVAWLEIDELGQNFEITASSATERLDVQTPSRYGKTLLRVDTFARVEVRRAQSDLAAGSIAMSLHCDASSGLGVRVAWFRSIQKDAGYLGKSASAGEVDALLERLRGARGRAGDSFNRALADHMLADALLVNGRSNAAGEAFAAAEKSWGAAGLPQQALAARVGRAENLSRAGAYAEAIELTTSPPRGSDESSYFAVRLENSRCLALAYLGEREAAVACWRDTAKRLDALDERTEWVNTIYSLASMYDELGRSAEAEQLAQRSWELATGPGAALVRGRFRLLMASIAMQRADIAAAVTHYDVALDEFATAGVARWEANARIKLAELYSELGVHDDAYATIGEVFSRLSPKDAPARVANALMMLAALDRRDGRAESASRWTEDAARIFTDLGMPAEREAAQLMRLRLQIERNDFDAAETTVRDELSEVRFNPLDAAMLSIELALARDDRVVAGKYLADLRGAPLSLRQRIDLDRLDAEFLRRNGQARRAEADLRSAETRIGHLAEQTDSRLLRHLLQRRVEPLRMQAFETLLADDDATDVTLARADSRSVVAALWHWVLVGNNSLPGELRRTAARTGAARYDAALAAELLPSASGSTGDVKRGDGQRELLGLLGASSSIPVNRAVSASLAVEDATASDEMQLRQLQAELDPDTSLIAHINLGTRGALLWVSADQARVLSSASAQQLRERTAVLRGLLQSPTTAQVEIERAARQLSSTLWPAVAGEAAPRRLLVVSGDVLGAMPWPVLLWPETSKPLIETTAVSLVVPGVVRDRIPSDEMPAGVQVIVAAQDGGGMQRNLPELSSALAEPALIAQALPARTIVVGAGAEVTRESILDALQKDAGWVHVAAHGLARAGRIGYSGLWLEPAQGSATPQFLSGLDILDRGVQSDLVVLNACQLGDNRDVARGNLGFAAAVIEAGASNVVAALWPVSDSAAALWVPAFYASASDAEAATIGAALRTAQLRLIASRAFRHPFYWASLRHIARLPVAVQN